MYDHPCSAPSTLLDAQACFTESVSVNRLIPILPSY